jgi:hypothetical protein
MIEGWVMQTLGRQSSSWPPSEDPGLPNGVPAAAAAAAAAGAAGAAGLTAS